jgi:DNA polymerase-4
MANTKHERAMYLENLAYELGDYQNSPTPNLSSPNPPANTDPAAKAIAEIQRKGTARLIKNPLFTPHTPPTPWFVLLDMNSYFATLEQQMNPYLRGKPVGIVKDAGRSCIIAASKEAKKLGVHTASSVYEARQLAPNLITVPADFDKYFFYTKKLKFIFESLSPNTDIFSLDEAFLDLSHCRQLYPSAAAFFTLGFGENRLQAKLASEFAGPDNFFSITADNLDACLSEAKVEDICGIGFRLTARLHALNIYHPYQLNFYDDDFLDAHFGTFWGPELRRIGQGKNSHLLDLVDRTLPHMKSVGRSKTLYKADARPSYVKQMIYNLAEDMCFKARRMKLAGEYVGVWLRDVNGQHWGGELRTQSYACYTDEVYELMEKIFEQCGWLDQPDKPAIIKVSVRLSKLKPWSEIPLCWLPRQQQRQKVFAGIDKINEKHGLYTVKSGRLLGFKVIMPEVTGFLGDKLYQFGQN